MIYNMTSTGQMQDMTSGQGHDLTQKGHVAYQSIRIVEMNMMRVV